MANNPFAQDYPWYADVSGSELEQGDILEGCPVFTPPDEFADPSFRPETEVPFRCNEIDVIVMSHTCDLLTNKLEYVLLCEVWPLDDLRDTAPFSNKGAIEYARRGWLPGYHMLAECELNDHRHGVRLVDFRRVYSLPVSFVHTHAAAAARIRLLPPYREHLSQAFGRFFMRVGLPVDIPRVK